MDAKRINLTTAAALIGCTRQTIYTYIDRGLLTVHTDANGLRYFLRSEVEKCRMNRPAAGRPSTFIR